LELQLPSPFAWNLSEDPSLALLFLVRPARFCFFLDSSGTLIILTLDRIPVGILDISHFGDDVQMGGIACLQLEGVGLTEVRRLYRKLVRPFFIVQRL
jgi:hypothetical protein